MIKGYRDFYYNVTNMNRAIDFYTQALGMKKASGHEHWTWGHMLVFEDLDGNVLKLMKPKV
jgi:predicted enzyme related to lactoylglutathione lyase